MIRNLALNRALFIVVGVLALVAAVVGVLDPGMYDPVVAAQIMPGVFTQDLLVIAATLLMIVLALSLRQDDYRRIIMISGVLGFLFYAYGIYAIEQVYTALYVLYLAVLASSFYVLAHSLASLNAPVVEKLTLPPLLRYGASGYGCLIAILFNFIWISQLIPLLREGDRIEYTFSVYIIDLAFIMPAFVIASILAIRKRALGLVGLPALFFLGVGILSPLALAELLKPLRYGVPTNPGELWLYGVLSLVFLVLGMAYLVTLRPSPLTGE
ncbi:MAG: hypothetical protein FJZ90_08740 [Chloroflexi bacterium]|nr:hypothetical protein [Chloroflexota bacterium]